MEMFELRYFYAVAESESVSRGADKLHVSASALSKAISRLEEELKVNLFEKVGRNIKLSEHGEKLFHQCSKFFELEQDTKILLANDGASFEVRLAGPEVFLSHFGVDLASRIRARFPLAEFSFEETDEKTAIAKVGQRVADLALQANVSVRVPGFSYKLLQKVQFATYAAEGHPLLKGLSKKNPKIHVSEILKFDFLFPKHSVLGLTNSPGSSPDGWRDDKFLRKSTFRDVGLKSLERLLVTERALAYLPEYLGESLPVVKIDVIGCPYACEQKIYLVTSGLDKKEWLKEFWQS